MTPAASIIIPTYNHAAYVTEAIESARHQTVPCEIIVVDDGSTDGTPALLQTFTGIRVIRQAHRGPAAARNAGLEAATGTYVMFLDGDDTIVPTKIQTQLAAFAPWVACDIQILDDVRDRHELASTRYGYSKLSLTGNIEPLLREQNLFPIHSPLVLRTVVADVRFDDPRFPEDWYFWHQVSLRTDCVYQPDVLGTYFKRTTGRSRLKWKPRPVTPTIVRPLRLNLGCGNPKNDSWHPLAGFINMDPRIDGWRFQDGLPEFPDASVAGITISHALMFVPEAEWRGIFVELRRVLEPGGVLRITEDHTADARSRTYLRGWRGSEPAVSLTSPDAVGDALDAAGFAVIPVAADITVYRDKSLCQSWHDGAPHCFFIEGVK